MSPPSDLPDVLYTTTKLLTDEEKHKLIAQNSRLVPSHLATQLERNARKYWDLFYKRNETRFFKDRRWTTREFQELLSSDSDYHFGDAKRFLEVGCGVGNLIFPLIEEKRNNFFVYSCDFSHRAIEFVKQNPLYDEKYMHAFQCDITTTDIFENIKAGTLDIITMVFVLSAIHPDRFKTVFQQLFELLRPGGVLLFRDYGLYDMAQLRFKAGHKIAENFYMRQDGTRLVSKNLYR